MKTICVQRGAMAVTTWRHHTASRYCVPSRRSLGCAMPKTPQYHTSSGIKRECWKSIVVRKLSELDEEEIFQQNATNRSFPGNSKEKHRGPNHICMISWKRGGAVDHCWVVVLNSDKSSIVSCPFQPPKIYIDELYTSAECPNLVQNFIPEGMCQGICIYESIHTESRTLR